jgi:DNA polymerase-3 subunit alpha
LERVANAVAECHRLGITVLPPDINHSQSTFSIELDDNNPAIRFGLTAIKNVGAGAIEPLLTERNKGGIFRSIEDLCRRADLSGVNRRVVESLIKAGALDSLGNRGTLLQNINSILSLAQREQRLRETGQSTMFDLWGEAVTAPTPSLDLAEADIPIKEKLAWERELIGVYLSEHPLSSFAGNIASGNVTLCGQIDAELAGQDVIVAGMVASVRRLFTRDRQPFASAVLEDLDGSIEVTVWPKVYAITRDLWQEGNMLLVEGKVKLRDDRVQLNCDRVSHYQPEQTKGEEAPISQPTQPTEPIPKSHRLIINITQTSDEESDIAYLHKLIEALRDFPGADEVNLSVSNEDKVINLKLSNIYVNYCPELHQRLVELIGEDRLRLEDK